jgi:hypothetical protein
MIRFVFPGGGPSGGGTPATVPTAPTPDDTTTKTREQPVSRKALLETGLDNTETDNSKLG